MNNVTMVEKEILVLMHRQRGKYNIKVLWTSVDENIVNQDQQ